MREESELEQPVVVHDEPSPESHRGDDRRGTRVETPYDAGFVEAIKSRWDHGVRLWDRTDEVWWVEEGREEAVEELVLDHLGGCRVVHEDGSETLRDRSGDYEQGGLF